MAGLRRICKALSGMTVTGNDGKTIEYVWDYAADEPVTKQAMPFGSDRHRRSECARWLDPDTPNAFQCAARGCDGCSVCKPPNV